MSKEFRSERQLGELRSLGSQGGRSAAHPGRLEFLFRRFPGTFILTAPYLFFVLPVAAINHNPDLPYIMRILGFACVGTVVVDLALPLPRGALWIDSVALSCRRSSMWVMTRAVTVVAVVTRLIYISSGFDSVSNQVNANIQRSTASNFAALFSAWPKISAALLACCLLGDIISVRKAYLTLGILFGVELFSSIQSQKLIGVVNFAVPLCMLFLLLGLVKLRHVLLAIGLGSLALPTLFQLRNASRSGSGVAVDEAITLSDRLRFDEQLALVRLFDVPVHIGQPGVLDILRYGLLPRAFDAARPSLSTSTLINQAMGGSESSGYSFLALGTILLFYGAVGLIAMYAGLSLILQFALRRAARTGPLPMVLAMLVISIPLNWLVTFPDALASFLQAVVSVAPIAIWATLARTGDQRLSRLGELESEGVK